MKTVKYNVNGEVLKDNNDDSLAFAKIVTVKEEETEPAVDNKTTVQIKAKDKETSQLETVGYFVKKCTTGADASHLLNPNSIWHKAGETKAYDVRSGKNYYVYARVNENCFKLYLRFLETKNLAYLRNAEREMY